MQEATCLWADGCDAVNRHGCGLCKRHWQAAKRRGALETYRIQVQAALRCAWCGGPAVRTRTRSKTYCSKLCATRWYRAHGAHAPTREMQRAYALKSRQKKRAELLASLGPRACAECGASLPADSRVSRRFCSRACTNQRSLRERAHQRRDANQRRRAKLASADSPGVLRRDWLRLVARFGGCCAYCGQSSQRLTMDHVVPVARGGRHAIGNVLPACFSCNSSKRDDLLIYWLNGRAKARLRAS